MNSGHRETTGDGADPSTICSEDEVIALVHRFYARVRTDEALAPIFDRHIHDWDAHLANMVDFWSATLFRRWLELFGQTTTELGNRRLKREADERAAAIALRFWERYQVEGHDVLAARR